MRRVFVQSWPTHIRSLLNFGLRSEVKTGLNTKIITIFIGKIHYKSPFPQKVAGDFPPGHRVPISVDS